MTTLEFNALTLLPGRETRLTFTPRHGASVDRAALASGLRLRQLRDTCCACAGP